VAFRIEIGGKVGRYRVDALLGQGGMGAVYRAHDTELGRDVALKLVVDEENPDLVKRIRKEARAASAFAHPNVATIFDVSEHEGRPFIVMEFVEGRSLRQLLADGSLTAEEKLAVMKQVGRALAAAHDRGLVHRDVKPDNIVVRADGVAKLLDFGIAKTSLKAIDPSAPTEEVSTITKTGTSVGSPAYMAPEQIQNRNVDERADQFAWAVTAFEIFAGELPWKNRGSVFEIAASILHEEPDELDVGSLGVAPETAEVITRALSKSASARFQDMHALLDALEAPAAQHEAQAAMATVPASKLRKKPLPMMPISLGLAALLGGYILLQHLKTYGDAPPPRSSAVMLGLNDDATLREQEALHTLVPKGNGLVSSSAPLASASSSPLARPPIVRCKKDPSSMPCGGENHAWCDAAGNKLACCVEGLVARLDGRCECPPGGSKSKKLQENGCGVADTDFAPEIQTYIRGRFGELRKCYETALARAPKIAGRIGVQFRISPEGLAYDASLSQTDVPDPVFQDCVVRVFETLQFAPPPNGDLQIDYPIVFDDGSKK
jgi:serine/threonine protein kinase